MKQRSLEVFSRDLGVNTTFAWRPRKEKGKSANGYIGREDSTKSLEVTEHLTAFLEGNATQRIETTFDHCYPLRGEILPRAFRDVKDRSALSGTTLTDFKNAKLDMYFNRNFSEWQPPNPQEGGAISGR